MKKSPDAFRTISEVAAWLDTPAHVLRFWESRFPDLKPVQRAGGRRYYRPQDMLLLGGIKHLLHTEGHTIKSVQDRIKAHGTEALAAFSPPLASVGDVSDGDGSLSGMEASESMLATAEAEAPPRPKADDDDAPPIGFFFDDSEDAAPAEIQSGTFAQPHAPDPPDAEGAPAVPPPSAIPFTIHETMPDPSPAPPRLGDVPSLPDDPADDATGYGAPLPLPARLRGLQADDVSEAHRDVLTGLFRRLDGWRRAQG